MRCSLALVTLLILAIVPIEVCATDICPHPHVVAPGKFSNNPRQWGSSDTGVISNGFVDLALDEKRVFDVVHGMDLSSNNSVDYRKLKDCGGTFAFVRLDLMYDHHVAALTSVGVGAIPYAFFPIPVNLTSGDLFVNAPQDSAALENLLTQFAAVGVGAANNLEEQLQRRGGLREVSFAGRNAKVLAVDIEQKLSEKHRRTLDERVAFGRAYARALCSWLNVVRGAEPSLVVVLYTTPSVYGDYLRYALPTDNACVSGLPIWLAHTTSDAGDSIYSSLRGASSPNIDEASQRLCLVNGGNRCVIHQYSHRSTFAALGSAVQGIPPHTDIDRWFTTKIVDAAAGPQYVRRDDILKPGTRKGTALAAVH